MRVLALSGALPVPIAPTRPPRAIAFLELLSARGHEVELIVAEPLTGSAADLARETSARIGGPVTSAAGAGLLRDTTSLLWAPPVRWKAERATPLAVQARALRSRFDVVLTFDDEAHAAGSDLADEIAVVADIQRVLGVRANGDWARTSRDRWRLEPLRRCERRQVGRAMAVMTPSHEALYRLDRLYYRRPAVVPSPVPVNGPVRAPAAADAGPVIGWCGDTRRPLELAGLERFLTDCWPHLNLPGAQLLMADAAPPRGLIAAAAIPGVQRIHGDDGLAEIAKRASLAVRPTWEAGGDGAPTLALMAAGLPVVGTPQAFEGVVRHEGMADLIVDDPLEMAGAIRRLAADPAAAQQLAAQSGEVLRRRHAPEAIATALEETLAYAVQRFDDFRIGRRNERMQDGPKEVKEQIERLLEQARAAS